VLQRNEGLSTEVQIVSGNKINPSGISLLSFAQVAFFLRGEERGSCLKSAEKNAIIIEGGYGNFKDPIYDLWETE
jgi:hypothetical protein